jgi:colanic acid biosynthesis glycosyl transferase WcaI
MNILIVSQYFWPEDFRINELAKFLSINHKVYVLTGYPNYPDGAIYKNYLKNRKNYSFFGRIRVYRVPIIPRGKNKTTLFLNYLSFLISASIFILIIFFKKKIDRIIVFGTSPPTVILPAILLSKIKNIPIVFWVLDLWPDTLFQIKFFKKIFFKKVGFFLMKHIYNSCNLILAQSESFIKKIKKVCNKNIKIQYFPSWTEKVYLKKKKIKINLKLSILNNRKYFKVMFTGNIGFAQDFLNIIRAASLLRNYNVRFIIVGTGSMFDWLKKEIELRNLKNNFILTGPINKKNMPFMISKADCLLITLGCGSAFNATIPGKLSNYLSAKKPIIGMISGVVKKIINNSRLGYACNSGEFRRLAKNIIRLMNIDLYQKKFLGQNAYNYYKSNFNSVKIFKNLENQIYVSKKL